VSQLLVCLRHVCCWIKGGTWGQWVLSDDGFSKFQSQLQNKDCEIEAIEKQWKIIGKMMSKMVKIHKEEKKNQKTE
jgi:hypothetical protein